MDEQQYYTKLQHKINEGDVLPRHEINGQFNNLSDEKKKQYEAGAERMKAMLVNIDELIRNSLNQTNETVSWEAIATMIAGDFSIQIQNAIRSSEASNKQTNQHQDQCAY